MTDFIYSEVQRCLKKYGTRNPYEFLASMKVVFRETTRYPENGLKGFCMIMFGTMYVTVNANLDDVLKKTTTAHEGAHIIVHRNVILSSATKMMKDFDIFNASGRYENEANFFVADYLLDDNDVMEIITDGDMDYFKTAKVLCIPAPLLDFKLYSMMRRGFAVKNVDGLNSRFLGTK